MSIKVKIPANDDLWDEYRQRFISVKETTLVLEHSLVSIKKWEQKYHKPFLLEGYKPNEIEMLDYIRCMTLNQNVDPNAYYALTSENVLDIKAYIENPMTATTITSHGKKQHEKEIMTAEVIYYYMFANGIPKECEKWHLNNLLMLLQVFGVKNSPDKENKMNKRDTAAYYAVLNKARRAKHHSKG